MTRPNPDRLLSLIPVVRTLGFLSSGEEVVLSCVERWQRSVVLISIVYDPSARDVERHRNPLRDSSLALAGPFGKARWRGRGISSFEPGLRVSDYFDFPLDAGAQQCVIALHDPSGATIGAVEVLLSG